MMELNWRKIITIKWFRRLYVLYIYGFIVNFRPSSPFIYEHLINTKNFSKSEVDEEIIPIGFYANAVSLVPIFLLIDFLKYNPFIILSSLIGVVATCFNIWTSSLIECQVAQAFYGCMFSVEIAYYVSIYAHGDVKNFQRLTSYVRAAPLAGKIVSTLLGHLLISQEWLDYNQLYYFDLAAFTVAVVLCVFLPPIEQDKKTSENVSSELSSIFSNFIASFPNKYVVKWSIWSILTICLHNQTSIYIQSLWRLLQTTKNVVVYNGALEGVYAAVALTGTILGGVANLDWKFKGDLILSMTSLVLAFMLLFVSQIDDIILNCIFYIIIGFIYHIMLTVLCGEIAKFLSKRCFGLLFGFIALIASVLSSGMICLLITDTGIELKLQDLFMVYGFSNLGVSTLFIIVGLSYWFAKHTYPV